jgi:hypothetical protein
MPTLDASAPSPPAAFRTERRSMVVTKGSDEALHLLERQSGNHVDVEV